MKRIEAIVRPHKVSGILAALARQGLTNVTVLETLGLARQLSFSHTYELASVNEETQTGLIPKRLLLLFVEDQQVQSVIDMIQPLAMTGEPGDGVVAVSQIDQIVNIRPKQK